MAILRIIILYLALVVFTLLLYPKIALGLALFALAMLIPKQTRDKISTSFSKNKDKKEENSSK